jgi:hypothetical protein
MSRRVWAAVHHSSLSFWRTPYVVTCIDRYLCSLRICCRFYIYALFSACRANGKKQGKLGSMSAVSSHDWKLSQGKVATYHHSHLFKRGGLERHNAAEFPNHEEAGRGGRKGLISVQFVLSSSFFHADIWGSFFCWKVII